LTFQTKEEELVRRLPFLMRPEKEMDYRIVFEKGRAPQLILGTQIDMAEEKRNCEWCVRGVVQKLFIFQAVVVGARRILRSRRCIHNARARALISLNCNLLCVSKSTSYLWRKEADSLL
jgi:hypothetical protein